MTKFLTRPMYGFGFVGIISIFISLAMSSYLIVLKIMGEDIGNRPLLMFALILGIAGVQLFSFGLLSELLIRTYHESQSRPIYRIRSINSAKQNWLFTWTVLLIKLKFQRLQEKYLLSLFVKLVMLIYQPILPQFLMPLIYFLYHPEKD